MKKILSLLLSAALCSAFLFGCAPSGSSDTDGSDTPTDLSDTPTDSSSDSSDRTDATDSSSASTSSQKPTSVVSSNPRLPDETTNFVIACDQRKDRVVVYDLDLYDGTDLESQIEWYYRPSGETVGNISGVKFRTDTVFGDVVLICCSGGYAAIVEYPSHKLIWSVERCGSNPHSIEILPSGNIVTASSTGNTLRLYYASALLDGNKSKAVTYEEYSYTDAHGVLWDPEYQLLWAAGSKKLSSYRIEGTGVDEKLVSDPSHGGTAPTDGLHDLSADFTDTGYLWATTVSAVYRFDKEANKFISNYTNSFYLNRSNSKGFGNNPSGNFVQCIPNKGTPRNSAWKKKSYADWCTDEIVFCKLTEEGKIQRISCVSSTSAYYKVFSFYGKYQ